MVSAGEPAWGMGAESAAVPRFLLKYYKNVKKLLQLLAIYIIILLCIKTEDKMPAYYALFFG